MPRCKPCLGKDVKEAILQNFPSLEDLLGKVPNCKDTEGLELCGRRARARTAYQEHTSTCMKAKKIKGFGEAPAAMRQCAKEWKEKHGKSGGF